LAAKRRKESVVTQTRPSSIKPLREPLKKDREEPIFEDPVLRRVHDRSSTETWKRYVITPKGQKCSIQRNFLSTANEQTPSVGNRETDAKTAEKKVFGGVKDKGGEKSQGGELDTEKKKTRETLPPTNLVRSKKNKSDEQEPPP